MYRHSARDLKPWIDFIQQPRRKNCHLFWFHLLSTAHDAMFEIDTGLVMKVDQYFSLLRFTAR